MIKVFIYNIFCIIAVVILVEMGIRDTNSSYAEGGMILIMIADIIGNIYLSYQSELLNNK